MTLLKSKITTQKKVNPSRPLESLLQKSICQSIFLVFPRAKVIQNKSVGVFEAKRGIFRKNNSPWSSTGSSDLFIWIDAKFIALEIKRDASSKPTQAQKEFIDDMFRTGHYGKVVWSAQMAIEYIREVLTK